MRSVLFWYPDPAAGLCWAGRSWAEGLSGLSAICKAPSDWNAFTTRPRGRALTPRIRRRRREEH